MQVQQGIEIRSKMIGNLIADEVKYVYFNCIVGNSYFQNKMVHSIH